MADAQPEAAVNKILRIFRNLIVLIGWSILFIALSNYAIRLLWRFDFLSPHSWNVLIAFWNEGGVIKTTSDILLLSTLALLPFLWLVGFFLVIKINFTSVFLYPVNLLYNIFNINNHAQTQRVVIKNIKSSQQIADDYMAEIDAVKQKKTKEAENIRQKIIKKRSKK